MKTQNINEDNTASSHQTSTAHAHQDKTRTIRRVLWWMGLVLLIPSLEGWTSSEDAFWIFREFPTPVAQYSNAVTQRIVTVLLVGFGCWCVVGLLKVTSVYRFCKGKFLAETEPQWENANEGTRCHCDNMHVNHCRTVADCASDGCEWHSAVSG